MDIIFNIIVSGISIINIKIYNNQLRINKEISIEE